MKLPTHFPDMPVVWLSLGNQIIIIGNSLFLKYGIHFCFVFNLVTIFFLNAFVYKRLQASGRSFPINSRIFIGLISATLAMCMAGTVEIFRQHICKTDNFTQTIGIHFPEFFRF
jgi:hypothetical protein